MDNMHEPPSGDQQDFWPTQELAPMGDQGEQAGQQRHPGQYAGQAGPHAGQAGQYAGQPGPYTGHAGAYAGDPGAYADHPGQYGPEAGERLYHPGQPGPDGPQPPWSLPPRPPGPPRRRGRAIWWGAGLALIALLAGGSAVAATQLSHGAASSATGPTGQAAQLNTLLNSASSPSSAAADASAVAGSAGPRCLKRAAKLKAAGHPFAARIVLHFCGHRLRHVRALGGIHGQFTFETKSGTRTLAYERGTIESVSSSAVVVQAADGTTWTWALESNTVIRENGRRATTSALSDGERVFAGGPVVSGANQARLIVVRASSGGASASPSPGGQPSPAPSPAAGS